MSGVVRRRLLEGDWAATDGQVFDNIDPDVHHIEATVEQHEDNFWWLTEKGKDPVRLNWFAGGQDWGFTNPGVMQVWGHGADDRWYMVEEVYQSGKDHEWWRGEIEKLHEKYDLWRIVSDPEDAAGIAMLNRRLIARDKTPLVMRANKHSGNAGRKAFQMAVHMRTMIDEDRMRWVQGARKHLADEKLLGKPKCSFEEIPALVWAKPPASRQYEEVGGAPPTDMVLRTNDHGYDATRYMHWALFQMDLTPPRVLAPEPYRVTDALTEDPAYRRMMKRRGA
jgi:hypothetical protein